MNNNLFVGNFPYETTQEELSVLFRPHGRVMSVKILVDRETGRSRGIAFVEMSSEAEAAAAIGKLNGTVLGARKIFVSEARPREKGLGGHAGKPGFVERRSGKDRRQAHGGPGGGFPRREERPRKPGFAGKKPWEKRPPFGGPKKPWEKRPAFGSAPKKPWGSKPGPGGDKSKGPGFKKKWTPGGPGGPKKWGPKRPRSS